MRVGCGWGWGGGEGGREDSAARQAATVEVRWNIRGIREGRLCRSIGRDMNGRGRRQMCFLKIGVRCSEYKK